MECIVCKEEKLKDNLFALSYNAYTQIVSILKYTPDGIKIDSSLCQPDSMVYICHRCLGVK